MNAFFISFFLPYFLRKDFSWYLKFTDRERLASWSANFPVFLTINSGSLQVEFSRGWSCLLMTVGLTNQETLGLEAIISWFYLLDSLVISYEFII